MHTLRLLIGFLRGQTCCHLGEASYLLHQRRLKSSIFRPTFGVISGSLGMGSGRQAQGLPARSDVERARQRPSRQKRREPVRAT